MLQQIFQSVVDEHFTITVDAGLFKVNVSATILIYTVKCFVEILAIRWYMLKIRSQCVMFTENSNL